jgi:gamma-tubulin complex component 3
VRDLLFVLQGIDGTNIKYSNLEDAYIVAPNVVLTPSTRKLIYELCELGWLFKKVNDWNTRSSKLEHSFT